MNIDRQTDIRRTDRLKTDIDKQMNQHINKNINKLVIKIQSKYIFNR